MSVLEVKGRPRICIVCSPGGHLGEARALRKAYEQYDHFFVINGQVMIPGDMVGRTYFIRRSGRDWRVFANLVEAWILLRRERPSIVLSTGAGPAVPFALVAKCLGIPFIFIEASTQVSRLSLSGRILYRFADKFFYQWKTLERRCPRGVYGGPIPWSS